MIWNITDLMMNLCIIMPTHQMTPYCPSVALSLFYPCSKLLLHCSVKLFDTTIGGGVMWQSTDHVALWPQMLHLGDHIS